MVYEGCEPADEGRREALCTLGNGYWATRARFRAVLPMLLCQSQELDLRRGTLTRINRYRDAAVRTALITSRQFQSLAHPHLAVLETTVDAENWSGDVVVVSADNGAVANRNAVADSHLAGHHLLAVGGSLIDDETVLWESWTLLSGFSVATALRSRPYEESGVQVPSRYRPLFEAGRAGFEMTFSLAPGHPVIIDTTIAVATSRDRALTTAVQVASQRYPPRTGTGGHSRRP